MIHSTSEKIIMRLRQPNFSRHIQGTQRKYSQLPKKRVWKRPGENQELWKVFFNLARCLYGADVAKLLMPKNELKKMLEAAMLRLKNFLIFGILQKAFLGLNNSQDLILKQYHYFYFALLRNEVNNYSWYFLKQRSNNGQQVEETLNIWRLTLPLNRDANWSIQAWVWVSNRIFKPTTTCFKKPPIPNHIQKPYDAFRSTVSHNCYRP